MASASAPTFKRKPLLRLFNSCWSGGWVESESHTVVACGSEHGTTPSCIEGSESVAARMDGEKCATDFEVVEQSESCKGQWSELSELAVDLDGEGGAENENREVFKTLPMHSIAPHFFRTFGYDLGVKGRRSGGELEIGEKFAEGGQAELFHVKVTWAASRYNQWDLDMGREWVLKVFKKGTLLCHLQSQWPQGYLQFRAEFRKLSKLCQKAMYRYHCEVRYAILLKDGRLAFLMAKEEGDMRSIIDENMRRNVRRNQGPFEKEKEQAEMIMYRIALGMEWMHNHNIIHRDLKASNVLMSKHKVKGYWMPVVADFECSIGTVGTGFWRAPEVLQACKERNVFERPELFTTQADSYSYGMTCYEILTGRYPFDGHAWRDYDLVLDGNRPEVPEYVEGWARELLKLCWQTNPMDRPSFKDILKILEDNSKKVRWFKVRSEAKMLAQM